MKIGRILFSFMLAGCLITGLFPTNTLAADSSVPQSVVDEDGDTMAQYPETVAEDGGISPNSVGEDEDAMAQYPEAVDADSGISPNSVGEDEDTMAQYPEAVAADSGISPNSADEDENIMAQCPYTVSGGTYGENYSYDTTSKKLTLYSGTLTVSGTANTSDQAFIEVAPSAVLDLTISDISPVTFNGLPGANGDPGLKIGAGANVNLILEGENIFCLGWDDIHSYSLYLDSNSNVTISGSGSLICKRNFGYPKLFLADTAQLTIIGGNVQFSGGQNSNSSLNAYTVVGSGKLVVDGGTVLIADESRGTVFFNNPQIELKSGTLAFEYNQTFGQCRLTMYGGTLRSDQNRDFVFENLQYYGVVFDFAGSVTFRGQTAINASLNVPENAKFIVPAGSTMTFAKGTGLTVSSGGSFQNNGTVRYYCQDTSIPAAAGGTTQPYHIYDQEIADDSYLLTAADCTNAAVYYKSCVCGAQGAETFESGSAVGHKLALVEKSEPICTAEGKEAYYTCSVCGKHYEDKDGQNEIVSLDEYGIIPAAGHEWGEPEWSWSEDHSSAAVIFTCKNDGSHTESSEVTISSETIAATCAQEGARVYTATTTFNDKVYTNKSAEAIPVIDHKAGTEWKADETSHWKECSECGAKLNTAAHTFAWVTDKAATEAEAGSRHEECTVCGYAKEAVKIPPAGAKTSPETGDNTVITIWASVMMAAGAALTWMALYSRKKKYNG